MRSDLMDWIRSEMTKAIKSGPRSVLGLTDQFTAEELRAAFVQRARETHPDAGGSAEEFRAVRAAYEALKD